MNWIEILRFLNSSYKISVNRSWLVNMLVLSWIMFINFCFILLVLVCLGFVSFNNLIWSLNWWMNSLDMEFVWHVYYLYISFMLFHVCFVGLIDPLTKHKQLKTEADKKVKTLYSYNLHVFHLMFSIFLIKYSSFSYFLTWIMIDFSQNRSKQRNEW